MKTNLTTHNLTVQWTRMMTACVIALLVGLTSNCTGGYEPPAATPTVVNGTDGKDGVDGTNGKDGTSCSTLVDPNDSNCNLIVCTDGTTSKVCNGVNGKDAPEGKSCSTNSECDDGWWCSVDICDYATKTCHNVAFSFCEEPEPKCYTGADCDDGDACTVDACVDGNCELGGYLDCDDGDGFTADSCDADLGCVNSDTTPCDNPNLERYFILKTLTDTCVGWPAVGLVNWTSDNVVPDALGRVYYPAGVCSVTCSSQPTECGGDWDGETGTIDPWVSVGAVHLVHYDGLGNPVYVDPGCTFDGLHVVLQ